MIALVVPVGGADVLRFIALCRWMVGLVLFTTWVGEVVALGRQGVVVMLEVGL